MEIQICYEALEDATVTSDPAAATGYPVDNLKDRSPENLYKPGSLGKDIEIDMDFGSGSERAADSLILCNHDLYTQNCGIKLMYSTTGSFGGEQGYAVGSAGAFASPAASDEPIWREVFTAVPAKQYWRLLVDNVAVFQMGAVFLGTKYTQEVYLPRQRRRIPHVARDYTDSGVGIRVKKGPSKKFRAYPTQSQLSSKRNEIDALMLDVDVVYHAVVLYVEDESLLFEAEMFEVFEDALYHYEDNRWTLSFLELPQV